MKTQILLVLGLVLGLSFSSQAGENLDEWYRYHAYCYNCKVGPAEVDGNNYYFFEFQCTNMTYRVRQYYATLSDAKKVRANTCKPPPRNRR